MRFSRSSLAFFAATVLSTVPLWVLERPCSQDWAQHVAAVRVLIDHDAPELRLARAVEIDFGRTQYVAFYVIAAALGEVFGAALAVKLLMTAVLFTVPYALRALLRATGGDERHAYFALSLTFTAHFLLGFLNFLAAVPLALFSLVMAARYREAPTLGRGLSLAALLASLFYMHVLPFALALAGVAIVLLGCRGRAALGALAALMPALLAAALWARGSSAGGSTLGLLKSAITRESHGETRFDPLEKTLREFPEWLTDVLPGSLDRTLLATACSALIVLGLALRAPRASRAFHAPRSTRALTLLPFVALALAFVMPYQHDWIWPVAGRFPYLALVLFPIALPRMRERAGRVSAAVLGALGLAHVALVGLAFYRVGRDEARGFDGALAAIPVGAPTLGLPYQSTSNHVRFNVFMQYHAHVQAERGSVVAFSFATLPQSPFVYRAPPDGPPDLNLGSGWAPQNADMFIASRYYEYALAHGEHPHQEFVERFYEPIYNDNRWTVYKRR